MLGVGMGGGVDIQQFISNHHSLIKNNSKATKSMVKARRFRRQDTSVNRK